MEEKEKITFNSEDFEKVWQEELKDADAVVKKAITEADKEYAIWAKCATIRAARTIAQAALACLGTAATFGEVNWLNVISVSLFSGLLSVLTSIVTGLPEADAEDEARQLEEARRLNGQD